MALIEWLNQGSPLFQEYLQLMDRPAPDEPEEPIGPGDALLVIDMQADFCPKHHDTNPQGGRFGVPEGDHIVPAINYLIASFVDRGGTVCASRDYHPVDHASFVGQGGPFPSHCIQGSPGSYFLPQIAEALGEGKKKRPDKVHVCFKAMHEHIDSFGALPYVDGGENRIQNKTNGRGEVGLPCVMGCIAAPWTGSLIMKMSNMDFCFECDDQEMPDMNAPPDVFATLQDGVDRGLKNLQDVLKPMKRLFICGLALDFCVLDSCLNGRLLGFDKVYMVLDAARAAHLAGVGAFGSGFLSDPLEVRRKMVDGKVGMVSAHWFGTGVRLSTSSQSLVTEVFPDKLLPIELSSAKLKVTMGSGTYTVALDGDALSQLKAFNFANVGRCSPFCEIPQGWEAPKEAVSLCWAYPMEGTQSLQQRSQLSFLGLSTSAELRFAAYGGFLLVDRDNNVVRVQSVDQGDHRGDFRISFGEPRKWRNEFTSQLTAAGRFQPVTLPELHRAGATHFCWLIPGETLTSGPENWSPSSTGAFLYQLDNNQSSVYFPIEIGAAINGETASSSDVKLYDKNAPDADVTTKSASGGCCVLQ